GPAFDKNQLLVCPEQLPAWVMDWHARVLPYKAWMLLVYPVGVIHDGALMGHGTPRYFSPLFFFGFYYLFCKYYFGLLFP
ncbi:MAG: hypothetical protein ACREJQ_00860, partial [bacterium]